MLDFFQTTNVQEDQQITTLLRSLRKEMNKLNKLSLKWVEPQSKRTLPLWQLIDITLYTNHE
jgi:hypothetical protein